MSGKRNVGGELGVGRNGGVGRGRAWEEELVLLVLRLGLEDIDRRSGLIPSGHHC